MNIDELWVGDKLIILESNEIGSFEGEENRKILVKVNNTIKRFEVWELAIFEEQEKDAPVKLNIDTPKEDILSQKMNFKDSIDLHIEKLNPSMLNRNSVTEILRYQCEKCEQFLQKAIQLKHGRITIIHGRGKGVLKEQIQLILATNKNVSVVHETNNGGALEVWLK